MRGKFRKTLILLLCTALFSTQTGLQPIQAAEEEIITVQTAEEETAAEQVELMAGQEKVSDMEGEEKLLPLQEEQTGSEEIREIEYLVVNPLYKDIISEEELAREIASIRAREGRQSAESSVSGIEKAAAYDTVDEAAAYLRSQMVARNETVTISISDRLANELMAIFDGAVAYTENCSGEEGDALQLGYQGYACSGAISGSTALVTYRISYYTTYEQEQELTKAVKTGMAEMQLEGKTEKEKVRIIHDYVCDHVDYDYSLTKYTAFEALCTGKSVCQGYAVLFYRLCKEEGLSVRAITGTGTDGMGNSGPHAWNIVKVGDHYYNVDCTWDGQGKETRHDWFLLSEADFKGHKRDAEYATPEFYKQFPMNPPGDENQYSSDHSAYIPDYPVNGYLYTGKAQKPKVVVMDGSGKELLLNKDYTVKYKKNVNAGQATITIKGKGQKKAEVGTKTIDFMIRPAELNETLMVSPIKAKVYAAKKQEPSVKARMKMTDGKMRTLKSKKDYTLSYDQNEDVGTATVIITGKGNYEGVMATTFEITEKPINKGIKVSVIAPQTYNGSARCPKPATVKFKKAVLKEGEDYTISYQNNTERGKAQIILTGVGNYTGTLKKYFKIV